MAKETSSQDSVRLKAQQMRAEQARKDRRIKITIISVVLVVVLGIAAAVAVVIGQKVSAERAARNVDPVSVFGTFAEGEPILYSHKGVGQVDDSIPTLVEYFDYSCHVCVNVDALFGKELTEGADKGEYNIEYRSVRTVDMAYQHAATAASLVVAQKAPERWADFHHALMAYFKSQYDNGKGHVVNDADASYQQVKKIAEQVGISADVIGTFPYGSVADHYLDVASQAWREATVEGRAGLGTPEFVAHGKAVKLQGKTGAELLDSVRAALEVKK
ncbi:DsbA family protein [Schaalia sp. lx-260]|uniref:DsbA family protein n=1 Tax=Schaalia sp. lx-260 TaxID=2899082 RepID=UPI001E3DC64D|nr:DsbA family protein [Schaalia sp. lx-260]MCD4549929.1 DsbA family protein [Schaalia sp. lx-260]